jgi:hypothetical protein
LKFFFFWFCVCPIAKRLRHKIIWLELDPMCEWYLKYYVCVCVCVHMTKLSMFHRCAWRLV